MLPLKKDFLLRFKKPNKSSLPNFNSSENLQYLPQTQRFRLLGPSLTDLSEAARTPENI